MGNSEFMWADFNEPQDLLEPVIFKTNNVVHFSKYKVAYNMSTKYISRLYVSFKNSWFLKKIQIGVEMCGQKL